MRSPAVPPGLLQRWNGPHWRWWSLTAGVLLLAATALFGGILARLLSQTTLPFIMLLMIIEILAISAVGSGLLDSATRTMSRGGLAREAADLSRTQRGNHERRFTNLENQNRSRRDRESPDARPATRETEQKLLEERERQERDRRTIRSALIVFPVLVAFVVLLFQV